MKVASWKNNTGVRPDIGIDIVVSSVWGSSEVEDDHFGLVLRESGGEDGLGWTSGEFSPGWGGVVPGDGEVEGVKLGERGSAVAVDRVATEDVETGGRPGKGRPGDRLGA